MKILIVEDDFTCRHLLNMILSPYGKCDVAVDGKEGAEAFKRAIDEGKPYGLVCLDIMMPKMDGREMLLEIRKIEEEAGIVGLEKAKVVMTTALDDPKSIIGSFKDQCEAYFVKPLDKNKIIRKLRELGIIK